MPLQRDSFAEPVRGILRTHTNALPLTRTGGCNREAAAALGNSGAASLFPGARAPEAALSGLLLLLGCWDESHEVSQNIASPDGSDWHAIAHRIEPDAANAGYWFRRVGQHAIFPELARTAAAILKTFGIIEWRLSAAWDPFLLIEWCEQARHAPGTKKEQAAIEMQRGEWELLFAWCASEPVGNK